MHHCKSDYFIPFKVTPDFIIMVNQTSSTDLLPLLKSTDYCAFSINHDAVWGDHNMHLLMTDPFIYGLIPGLFDQLITGPMRTSAAAASISMLAPLQGVSASLLPDSRVDPGHFPLDSSHARHAARSRSFLNSRYKNVVGIFQWEKLGSFSIILGTSTQDREQRAEPFHDRGGGCLKKLQFILRGENIKRI